MDGKCFPGMGTTFWSGETAVCLGAYTTVPDSYSFFPPGYSP